MTVVLPVVAVSFFSLMASASTIANVSVSTSSSGSDPCSRSVTGSNVEVFCQSDTNTGPFGYASGNARADFLALAVSAFTDSTGGAAAADADAGYDELVVINGGSGSGMLTGTYSLNLHFANVCISQGQDSVCESSPNNFGPPVELRSSFTYGVPFEMSARLSAQALGILIYDTRGSVSGTFFVDQNGNTVSPIVVSEPATGSLLLLALFAAVSKRLLKN